LSSGLRDVKKKTKELLSGKRSDKITLSALLSVIEEFYLEGVGRKKLTLPRAVEDDSPTVFWMGD